MSAEPVVDLRPDGEVARLRALFDEVEPRVHAFTDEPGRWERVAAEVGRCGDGPLAGVPVAVKDVFRVDGLPTTAGSRLPTGVFAGPEAIAVTRLRAAGAVVVGKAATTEFAYFAPGPTANPHDLEHTPGGSSSGSAAAVATGQCVLALGTQTIGSVGRPASFCGVVGYKPSRERIPRDGLVALAPSFDHVGVFAPSVAWASKAAAVLVDGWRDISVLSGAESTRPRLGIPTGPYLDSADPVGRAHFDQVCVRLRAAGFEVAQVPLFANFTEIVERHRRLVAAEAAAVHAVWFDTWRSHYREATVELVERGRALEPATVASDREACAGLRSEVESARVAAGIDLWIAPAAKGPAPRGLASTGDPILNLPWTQAGVPALVVPSGHVGHLPVGLQLVAGWQLDEDLLAWASGIETALGGDGDDG